ncbi:MAG: flagellin lysine-N-methylase [Roseburia sp.]
MKNLEIKPTYYDNFRCIAGDCPITCCQEWKIAVDDKTKEGWKQLRICDTDKKLTDFLCQKDGGTVIGLNEEKKCPFLDEKKLCKLVIQLGEETLSETCTLFPRQIHEFEGRTEYSLVACCPEIVDILKKQERIAFTEKLSALEEQGVLFEVRNLMFSILEEEAYPVAQALKMCFYVLLDMYEKALEEVGRKQNRAARRQAKKPDAGLLQPDLAMYTKEAIAELADAMAELENDPLDTFDECNELFLDLAENYRKEGIYQNFLEELAQLAEQFTIEYDAEEIADAKRLFDEAFLPYEAWMRNYLVAEIFASFLLPDSNLEDLVVALQWIGIEYASMKQVILLQYIKDGKEELSEQKIRDTIVYIARMTGYDGEDVREYLENSFQTLIWEWGYFALIVG